MDSKILFLVTGFTKDNHGISEKDFRSGTPRIFIYFLFLFPNNENANVLMLACSVPFSSQ